MSTIRVSSAGALTTVQDGGRQGWRHLGVGLAGALDPTLARLANRMVGNDADAAVLEIAMTGPTLVFDRPIRIAMCGGGVEARFEDARGDHHPLPGGRPLSLPAGTLRVGATRNGLRAWLAIAGGIDVPTVLGSRSTDLRGGFGGLDGRALQAGDVLPLGPHARIDSHAPEVPSWWVALDDAPAHAAPLRYVPSAPASTHACTHACAHPLAEAFGARAWRVDPRSNRQGLRFAGEALIPQSTDLLSAPVAPGTIQLPPDGQPIVLLADAQTVGGYPRLGHVIAADLPRMAQLRAGDDVRFAAVSTADAHAAWQRRQAEIARLQWAIDRRLAIDARPHG